MVNIQFNLEKNADLWYNIRNKDLINKSFGTSSRHAGAWAIKKTKTNSSVL